MTEAEWLACGDPARMIASVSASISERKLRLFAAACCRMFAPSHGSAIVLGVAVAERAADGEPLTSAQMRPIQTKFTRRAAAYDDLHTLCAQAALTPGAGPMSQGLAATLSRPTWPMSSASVAGLLRETINPFHSASLPTSMLAWEQGLAPRLANVAYEKRELPSGHLARALLAVLSDALEEAGCTDADLLNHLRSPGPHVRGCWALDLVLGKS